jgi:putative peptidoglycan lipid II flippase
MVSLITIRFAAGYGQEGPITVLRFSNNLMQAPLGIFGQGLALAAFPTLAEFVAIKRMDLYRSQVSKTLRTVLYLGLPSGAFMFALAPQIVEVLYGYRKVNGNPETLLAISDCLRLYAFAIFAWCLQPVMMRGFFSLHKTLKPIAISTLMTVVFICLCVIAKRVSTDFRAIPIATDVAALLLAVTLYFALEKDVGKLDRRGIATTLVLAGVSAAIAGAFALGLVQVVHPNGRFVLILWLAVVATSACWVYFYLTRWMKLPETEYVSRSIDRLKRRLPGSGDGTLR